ncbi:MHYT domain-containing protein [Streptomyces sp. HMX112]|uniref:MHYT domain-containing protein n=1 Tax=Streptomyces sp. HMX112 TaxID=3390850 RepID=UPI003A7FBD07
MRGTVDGFSHGLVTPVAAYLVACLGAALGLRCVTRSLRGRGAVRPAWSAAGALAIGTGVWTMHFIAMTGFRVAETPVGHDRSVTFASLAVAIVMTGVGTLIVGHRGATAMSLVTGGTITGLGIATMHYLGMAGVRLEGRLDYHTLTVALSVVVAVVAATSALWAAVSARGVLPGLAACLVMGVAVAGMHYTGMAAVSVHLHGASGPAGDAGPDGSLLVPMLVGPAVFLVVAALLVAAGPLPATDGRQRRRPELRGVRRPWAPARRGGAHREPAGRPPVRPPRGRERSRDR